MSEKAAAAMQQQQQFEHLERNCAAAATLFIAAIVCDGLSATDPPSTNQSPASMRCSAAILIACLAAPPLREQFVFEQRAFIGTALVAVALTGLHKGSEGVRVVDAFYVWLVLSLTLLSFVTGGINFTTSKVLSLDVKRFVYRESVCSMAVATLGYSGARIVRQAFDHAEVARRFQVASTAWDGTERLTGGYAAASTASVAALAFGGAIAMGLAVILFSSNTLRESGTSAKKEILVCSAFLLLFAAFFANVALSEQFTSLTAIWGDAACTSTTCPAAGLARRTSLVNATPIPLWLNAFGCVILAYAPDAKVQSREDEIALSNSVILWGLVSLLGCAFVTLNYASFTGTGALVDYSMMLSIASIIISAFVDTWYGSLIFLVAIGTDEVLTLYTTPASEMLTYFTHCSLLVSFILLILRVGLSGVTRFFWREMPSKTLDIVDDAVGLVTVAGTSITTALYLGSSVLIVSYPGNWLPPSYYESPDNRYARTWLASILEHFLPVLIWLPMYFRKQEVGNIASFYRRLTWLLAPLVPLLTWGVALAVAGQPADHAMWAFTPSFLFGAVSVLLVPWASIALV